MNRLFLLLGAVCLVMGTYAPPTCAESKNGAIKFSGAGAESVNVAMGSKLKLAVTFKQIKVGTINAVSVSGNVNNTSGEKLFYAYFVSFLDKEKNLVGCQAFNLFVDGGKQGSVGTFIQLPPDQISRIASYAVTFYEGAQSIGN